MKQEKTDEQTNKIESEKETIFKTERTSNEDVEIEVEIKRENKDILELKEEITKKVKRRNEQKTLTKEYKYTPNKNNQELAYVRGNKNIIRITYDKDFYNWMKEWKGINEYLMNPTETDIATYVVRTKILLNEKNDSTKIIKEISEALETLVYAYKESTKLTTLETESYPVFEKEPRKYSYWDNNDYY